MALDLQPESLFHTDVQTQQHSLSYSVGLPAALPAVEGCSKAELVGASGVGGISQDIQSSWLQHRLHSFGLSYGSSPESTFEAKKNNAWAVKNVNQVP